MTVTRDTSTKAVEYELWLSFGRAKGGLPDLVRALAAERDRYQEALEALEPRRPQEAEKDGPCCHEQDENGFWTSTGCHCGNYDDAQSAAEWAASMNAWNLWDRVTRAAFTDGEEGG